MITRDGLKKVRQLKDELWNSSVKNFFLSMSSAAINNCNPLKHHTLPSFVAHCGVSTAFLVFGSVNLWQYSMCNQRIEALVVVIQQIDFYRYDLEEMRDRLNIYNQMYYNRLRNDLSENTKAILDQIENHEEL